VPSALEEPPTADVSLHWVVQGWPEDVARALAGFRAFAGGRDVQYVVADATDTDPSVYGEGSWPSSATRAGPPHGTRA
jgi:hypothetical protein